jgi:hypothetical protein
LLRLVGRAGQMKGFSQTGVRAGATTTYTTGGKKKM